MSTRSNGPSDGYVPRHAPARPRARAAAPRPKAAPKGNGNGVRTVKRPARKRSFLRRWWWAIALAVPFLLFLMVAGGIWLAYARIELPDTLPPIQTTYLYDRDGELITTLHGAVDRTLDPPRRRCPRTSATP